MPRLDALLAVALCCGLAVAGGAAAKEKAPPARLSDEGRNNVMLAQDYLNAGKLDQAEERARAALSSDGDSALPHAVMALVRAGRKQQGKAKDEFERALALDPASGEVLNAYGAWLCSQGDRAGADDAFRRALQDWRYISPAQALVNAGHCALLGGDLLKGEGYLRRAVVMVPQNREILLLLANAELKLGRPMDARAFAQRSDALGPDAHTLELAARIEDAAGDAVSAARYRKRLQDQFPKYVPAAEAPAKP